MGAPAVAVRPTVYEFRLPITTEADLSLYLKLTQGIEIPDVQVCPDHSTPWRAYCDVYFARHSVVVWKASRGFGGKSHNLASVGLAIAQTLKVDVNLLGGSGTQAQRVHEHQADFWRHEHAPHSLLVSDPAKEQTHLAWGNKIQVLMASQKSVRGPHPVFLAVDEADECDLRILDAAFGQTMSKPPADDRAGVIVPARTLISSTHQYPDGTFTEIKRRVAEKGWKFHEWCYRESMQPHGWLDPAEVERKRGEVTASMWQVEYDGQEPSAEGRAILPEAVDWTFASGLGDCPGEVGRYYEFEAPEAGATYATGADWARKTDMTVIDTLRTDCRPARRVAWERRQRQPWPVMIEAFNRRLVRYPGAACHDGTGIGDVIREWVNREAEAFQMVGKPRTELFTNYVAAMESQGIRSPRIAPCEAAHRYAVNDDLFGSGHPPDEVVAGALAYKAAGLTMRPAMFW